MEQCIEALFKINIRMLKVGAKKNLPITLHLKPVFLNHQQVPGGQFMNSLEQGFSVQTELEGKIIPEAIYVRFNVI